MYLASSELLKGITTCLIERTIEFAIGFFIMFAIVIVIVILLHFPMKFKDLTLIPSCKHLFRFALKST